jgi:hypothetical protein
MGSGMPEGVSDHVKLVMALKGKKPREIPEFSSG